MGAFLEGDWDAWQGRLDWAAWGILGGLCDLCGRGDFKRLAAGPAEGLAADGIVGGGLLLVAVGAACLHDWAFRLGRLPSHSATGSCLTRSSSIQGKERSHHWETVGSRLSFSCA